MFRIGWWFGSGGDVGRSESSESEPSGEMKRPSLVSCGTLTGP